MTARVQSKNRVYFHVALLGALALLVASAFSAAAAEPQEGDAWFKQNPEYTASGAEETIKVGVLVPYTGGYAPDATEIWNAINLSIDDLNGAGGIVTEDGTTYKLEPVLGDTLDMQPDQVTTAFQQLLNDGVDIIMSAFASGNQFELDLMAENDMPYLLSSGATEVRAIVQEDPDKYWQTWNFVPSYDAYNTEFPRIVESWIDDGKVEVTDKSVFIITADNAYSNNIALGQRATFESLGWDVVGFETVPNTTINDWRALLAKVKAASPAVIVNTDWQASNNASFIKQFREAPSNSIVFIQYGPINAEYCDLAGEDAPGIVYQSLGGAIMGGTSHSAEMAAEVRAKYEALHGPSGYFYNTGYWMPQLYAQAIQATGGVDHRAVADWIGQLDVITGSGRLVFDPETHLGTYGDEFLPLQLWQIMPPAEGASAAECERPLIYPPTLTDDEFQLPPWAENPLGS